MIIDYKKHYNTVLDASLQIGNLWSERMVWVVVGFTIGALLWTDKTLLEIIVDGVMVWVGLSIVCFLPASLTLVSTEQLSKGIYPKGSEE